MRFDLSFVTESAVQQEPVQFNTPEPYKQSEASAIADNSLEDGDETLDTSNSEVKSTLWQTLNDRTSTSQKPPKNSQSPATATDRMDMDVDYSDLQDYKNVNAVVWCGIYMYYTLHTIAKLAKVQFYSEFTSQDQNLLSSTKC